MKLKDYEDYFNPSRIEKPHNPTCTCAFVSAALRSIWIGIKDRVAKPLNNSLGSQNKRIFF